VTVPDNDVYQGFEWRDPPNERRAGKWVEILTPVMEHPGRWAAFRIPGNRRAYATITGLRNGTTKRPPGKWEFKADAESLFARYIGPE
jgi:hypothetical protein